MKTLKVPGHTMDERGGRGAHSAAGEPLAPGTVIGYARCSCGKLSAAESGPLARRRWHRRHREEIAKVPWL